MPGDGKEAANGAREAMQCDPAPRRFTWEELSKLNGRYNAHVAVRGKVYDVSGFINKHPGGASQLLLGAGRDVTTVFESYHHFSNYKVLQKFYVGELVSNELPVFPEPSAFHRTVRERVEKYFKENKIDPKISYWMFFRYFLIFACTILCWFGLIQLNDILALSIPLAFGWGFSTALITMTPAHDSSHFSITHKPWVWRAVGFSIDFFQGVSMYVWLHQHIIGHHSYPNIDGADPDIYTAADELPDVRRIKLGQRWLPHYFYQHIYIPILYSVVGIKFRLQDFYTIYSMKYANIRLNQPTNKELFFFFAGKLMHVLYRFVIMGMFMSWQRLLLFNLIWEIAGSYWLILILQLSHVASEVVWPKPDKDNVLHIDWAEMQVATTQDYATDSWFWTVFTGALNHQTAHHLFPGVNQAHYPLITPIVRRTCEEFGVKYHSVNTMWEAIGCHFNHLKALGQSKDVSKEE